VHLYYQAGTGTDSDGATGGWGSLEMEQSSQSRDRLSTVSLVYRGREYDMTRTLFSASSFGFVPKKQMEIVSKYFRIYGAYVHCSYYSALALRVALPAVLRVPICGGRPAHPLPLPVATHPSLSTPFLPIPPQLAPCGAAGWTTPCNYHASFIEPHVHGSTCYGLLHLVAWNSFFFGEQSVSFRDTGILFLGPFSLVQEAPLISYTHTESRLFQPKKDRTAPLFKNVSMVLQLPRHRPLRRFAAFLCFDTSRSEGWLLVLLSSPMHLSSTPRRPPVSSPFG
jgi:hypothetical protein